MGEHRNDLCQLAQSLVDIAIGQIPHFKLTRYRIPPLPPLRVARRMLVRRLSGLVGKCSAQNQQMLWATTVFVDCRDAPLAAEHAVVHAIFVDAARSMPCHRSIVACPNDKAAIKVAEQWAQEHEVEVWEKSRFIAPLQLRKENPA
jgi:hypothetical protein